MNHDKTTRKALLLAASLLAGPPAWADRAWELTYYNAATGQLQLLGISLRGAGPTVGLAGGQLIYKGGREFELLGSFQFTEMHSRVTSVRVVDTAPPVIVVSAELESACYKLDPAISPAWSGNEIRIQVKTYFFGGGASMPDLDKCGTKMTAALPFDMNREQYSLQPGTYTVIAQGKEGSASTTFYYPGPVVP